MRYVEIMKCPKEEQVIFGIVGGVGHHFGVNPFKLRIFLAFMLSLLLFFWIKLFFISVLCYLISYCITPNYEEMYDREVNPDARPMDF